jgi:hypothetical protein
VIYAFQRFSYERFYEHFGITPEDVGVDAGRILSQTGFGLAILVSLFLIYLVGICFLLFLATRVIAAGLPEAATHPIVLFVVLIGFAVIALFAPLIIYSVRADRAGKCAAMPDGPTVRGLGLSLGARFTVLGVRAERAVLKQKWAARNPPKRLRAKTHVVYLGESGGRVVVYNPYRTRNKLMRIPSGEVTVVIDTESPDYENSSAC